MKNSLSVLFVVCSIATVTAQFKKGNLQLAASVTTRSTTIDGASTPTAGNTQTIKNKGTGANLLPGIFISDHSVLGLNLGYTSSVYQYTTKSSNGTNDSYTQKQDDYAFGLFYTWYKPISEKFSFFLTVTPTYDFGEMITKDNSESLNTTPYSSEFRSKNHQFLVRVYPGVIFSVSKRWAVTGTFGTLSYANSFSKPTVAKTSNPNGTINSYTTRTNSFNLDLRLSSFSAGVLYFIHR